MKQKIIGVTDPQTKFVIEESAEVDGQHVLAKVKGVFFCPDAVSRNNRFYSKKLWENAIEKSQSRLSSKTMYGTIGHETELNDISIAEGKVSHITTNVYIDENNQGIGEALILNTPSGKILNTLLRAGSELYVSSRAEGKFNGSKDGVPAVDENVYNLIGWDFVLNPGFLKANPKLAEEFNNLENNEQENEMELLEKLTKENFEIKARLEEATSKVKSIEEVLAPLKEENAHLTSELAKVQTANEELVKESAELKTLKAIIDENADSVEELVEALQVSADYIDSLHEEIGTKEEIEKALTLAEDFKAKISEIGDIEDITKALKYAEKVIDEKIEAEKVANINALAEKYSVKAELVSKLLEKNTQEEAEAILVDMAPKKEVVVENTEEVIETEEKVVSESNKRLQRLMKVLG